MRPGPFRFGRFVLPLMAAGAVIVLLSWNHRPAGGDFRQYHSDNDTVPPKQKNNLREKKVRNLDEALEELNAVDFQAEMQKAQEEMRKAMKEIDGQKIRAEIDKAMQEADMSKIQEEMKTAMSELSREMANMRKELRESLNEAGKDNIRADIDKAMKNIDVDKMEAEIKASIASIDMGKMKAELEELKKDQLAGLDKEMEKVKAEMEKIGPEIEKAMEKAKAGIEKAKVEIKEYKAFVDGLDKDGLINKNEPYTIDLKNGELLINGRKAPAETYNKYKSFLQKHPKLHINSNSDDFNINVD